MRSWTVSIDPTSFAWEDLAYQAFLAGDGRVVSAVEAEASAARVDALLDRLPEKLADAAQLVLIQGLSYRKAADLLGVPRSTLHERVEKAAVVLRALVVTGDRRTPGLWMPGRPRLASAAALLCGGWQLDRWPGRRRVWWRAEVSGKGVDVRVDRG